MQKIKLTRYISSTSGLIARGVISNYISLIWTTRWNSAGDFQLVLDAESPEANRIWGGDFLLRDDQAGVDGQRGGDMMVVEKVTYEMSESGERRKILTGRNLLGFFCDRRVTKEQFGVVPPTTVSGLFYMMGQKALIPNESVVHFPVYFGADGDETVTGQTVIPVGTNLLKGIEEILTAYKMGITCGWDLWRTTYESKPCRFYTQTGSNSSVVMSDRNGMVRSYSYSALSGEGINRVVVAGEQTQDPSDRQILTVNMWPVYPDFSAVETFVDASNIRKTDQMTMADYQAALTQAAKDAATNYIRDYQVSLDTSALVLPRDLALGATAMIETQAFSARVRLVEIIDSIGENGDFTQTPTFAVL